MRRILVTGMSGTGKSSALERLRLLGFRAVDTDEGDWTEWSDAEGGYVWREELIAELLAHDGGPALYVSGTVSNQGRFYDRFDAVVLLSAPAKVLLRRIETRTTNPYGKTAAQREVVLRDLAEVEPARGGRARTRSTLLGRSKTWSPSSRSSVSTAEQRHRRLRADGGGDALERGGAQPPLLPEQRDVDGALEGRGRRARCRSAPAGRAPCPSRGRAARPGRRRTSRERSDAAGAGAGACAA